MKKLIMAVAVATSFIPSFASANIDDALQNICSIVAADDKGEFRKKMRTVRSEYNIRLSDYYTGIACNNMSLIRHAAENNAEQVGTLMVSRMKKSDLAEPEKDGQTLLQWLNSNGYSESPVTKELIDRLG